MSRTIGVFNSTRFAVRQFLAALIALYAALYAVIAVVWAVWG